MADATLVGAIAWALWAGVLTFFSPCAYALLPGYVGYYVSQAEGRSTLGGAVARGLVAGVGALCTLGTFVTATFLVGQSTFERLMVLEPAIGAVLILFGVLVVLGRSPTVSIRLPKRRSSVSGFAIFGAGYALAAAGCVAPFFLSVVTFAMTVPAAEAALVLGAYVGSVVVLMVALTVATGMGLVAGGGWFTTHRSRLVTVAGILMVLAGIGQLYVAYAVDVTV